MDAGARREVNALSHLVGAVLALAGLVALVWRAATRGDSWSIAASIVYGATLLLLYTSSALYHSLQGRAKAILRRFDHSAIYLLIAGTYAPFSLVTLRGAVGFRLLGAVSSLAAAGIVCEFLSLRRRSLVARYQIRVMEGVLERAVQHGAHVVSAEIREVAPDLVFFSGPARARGFQLEGYGVFFSVVVPAVRRSLVWSFRTLNPDGRQVEQAMASRRAVEQFQADARTKRELQQALRLVELQVGPLPAGADVEQGQPGAAGRPVEVEQAAAKSSAKRAVIAPDEAYEAEVKQALVDRACRGRSSPGPPSSGCPRRSGPIR